jgi:hypothetical protein
MIKLRYVGPAQVREISSEEIESAWGISGPGVSIDTRVDPTAVVSNRLGAKLLDMTEEFVLVHAIEDDDPGEVPGAAALIIPFDGDPDAPIVPFGETVPEAPAVPEEPKAVKGSARKK